MQQNRPTRPQQAGRQARNTTDGYPQRNGAQRQPPPREQRIYKAGQAGSKPSVAQGRAQDRRRSKARRRREIITFMVMTVLLVVLLLVALLFAGGKKPAEESSSIFVFVPSSSSESVESVSSSSQPVQVDLGPYDEADPPPLFNFENAIPQDYLDKMLPTLTSVGGGQQMEKRAAEAFIAMSEAATVDGVSLDPVSGYRTNARQTDNYNASIQRYLDQGMSRDEAVSRTEGYYAIPGTSEHEAGLAMDIGWIENSFENSEAFAWLSEHAAEYGFILRYRSDTFEVTRIRYEPWHYRYVGANHAKSMLAEGYKTLEEYVAVLEANKQ